MTSNITPAEIDWTVFYESDVPVEHYEQKSKAARKWASRKNKRD